MAKSKKKNDNRKITLELEGKTLVMDLSTDAGLSLLASLLFAALADVQAALNAIDRNTQPRLGSLH